MREMSVVRPIIGPSVNLNSTGDFVHITMPRHIVGLQTQRAVASIVQSKGCMT